MKEFIRIMRGEQKHKLQCDRVIVKRSKKTNMTKFKLRTPKYLLTLKVDQKKAEKITQAIPSGLKKVEVDSSKK